MNPSSDGNNVARFEELIKNSTIMLMNKQSLEYFGILSYGIQKKVFSKQSYQQLYGAGSLGFTDGHSITYMVNDDAALGDVIFVTIHELLHIISYHVQRLETRDRYMWNLAVDQVVNSILYDLSKETRTVQWQECCFLDPELYNTHKNASAEEIYKILMSRANQYKIERIPLDQIINGPGNNGGGSSSDGGNGGGSPSDDGNGGGSSSDGENGSGLSQPDPTQSSGTSSQNSSAPGKYVIKVTDTKTGKTYYVADDVNFVDSETNKDTKDALEEIAEQARMAWNSGAISKGNIPGSLCQFLDDMFKVEVPWHELLENAIKYTVQSKQDVSWNWPNEVYRAVGFHLPGQYDEELPDTLIAAIDSSGSLPDDDLKIFIGILCSACQHFDKIIVLVHDVEVHQEIVLSDDLTEDMVFEQLRKIVGRGGTSHGPVLRKIGELEETHRLSCVMFLTDFYSDVPHYALENTWMKEYETIWVLNSNVNVDLPADYPYKEIRVQNLTVK